MTAEAPQQIDLSRDIKDQNTRLSPEQQESFQAYLDGLQEEEKQGIIYLTQQELTDLASIVEQSVAWENDAQDFVVHDSEKLDSFIGEQKTEGISLEDMIWGLENAPEPLRASLESLEKVADKVLFGSEGMFQNLDISDTAKDHISMSLIMSLSTHGMKQLIQKMQKEDFDSSQIMARFTEIAEWLKDTFWTLKSVIDETETSDQWNSIVNVKERWEWNRIFMEIATGKKFFDDIISGKITQKNIEGKIEAENLEDGEEIDNNLESIIWDFTKQSTRLQDAIANLPPEDQAALATAIQNPGENWEPASENGQELTGFAKIIHDILKALTEGLKWFTDAFDFDNDQDDNIPEEESLPEEEQAKNNTLIELIDNLSPANSDFVKNLTWDPKWAQRIRKILEWISPDESFQETLNNILNKDKVLSSTGIKAGPIFEEYGFLQSLPEWMNQIETTIKMLEEYSRYRNSDGVRGLSSSRTPWEEWAQKRQAENWSIWGR